MGKVIVFKDRNEALQLFEMRSLFSRQVEDGFVSHFQVIVVRAMR